MAIKRRSTAPTDEDAVAMPKLVITTKDKKPLPDMCRIHPADTAEKVRYTGVLQANMCNPADELMNATDYVTALRTPYDVKNPQEIRYRNRARNRGTAITAMCIVCVGGRKAVTECVDTSCPLWAFRFGGDPFYGKR